MDRHTKWPIFMRMHGSILPKMILPLLFVAGWSTLITCISAFVHNLGISSLLLTITGFVVSLGLSFRSSTAYERYNEGRKYWTQLIFASQALSRVIWVHGGERWADDPKVGKQDLLAKMTALNLITAFGVSLKHKLRFEPYSGYEDLSGLVGHLDTFAKAATKDDSCEPRKINFFKSVGIHLGVSFAESNPRRLIKKSKRPLGNLPLEILTYLAAYIDDTVEDGKLKIPMQQTIACKSFCYLTLMHPLTFRQTTTSLPLTTSLLVQNASSTPHSQLRIPSPSPK
jgi:putative membrane protein